MDKAATARAMFAAFRDDRRAEAERLVAADFTFTSPYDDAIDRKSYFERCWPNNKRIGRLVLERVSEDADGAFVTYLFENRDGTSFRNTEYLTVRDGRIVKVDVYFGASYRDGEFVAKKPG